MTDTVLENYYKGLIDEHPDKDFISKAVELKLRTMRRSYSFNMGKLYDSEDYFYRWRMFDATGTDYGPKTIITKDQAQWLYDHHFSWSWVEGLGKEL